MSRESHYQNIRTLRAEQAKIEAEIAKQKKLLCQIRACLLSEIDALQAGDLLGSVDPGEEMYQARENWGVEDA